MQMLYHIDHIYNPWYQNEFADGSYIDLIEHNEMDNIDILQDRYYESACVASVYFHFQN